MRSSGRRSQAADVARRELIGLDVTVESRHPGFAVAGKVVDETKHTFLVETAPKVVKRIPKTGNRFLFRAGTDAVLVEGADIIFRPEDRTKRIRG